MGPTLHVPVEEIRLFNAIQLLHGVNDEARTVSFILDIVLVRLRHK
jgi:hypothetical protein